jgi:hypothetical protein
LGLGLGIGVKDWDWDWELGIGFFDGLGSSNVLFTFSGVKINTNANE